jgi:vacuolar-type H+-ATPase subunit H
MGSKKLRGAVPSADDARDFAGSAVETVREHASSAGESAVGAVTAALDDAAARSRRARKKARRKAHKQAQSARTTAQETVYSARRQSARQLRKAAAAAEKRAAQLDAPKRRRGRVFAALVAISAVGFAAAKSRGAKDSAPTGPSARPES